MRPRPTIGLLAVLPLALAASFWPALGTRPCGDDFSTMSPAYAVWPGQELTLARCFVPHHPSRYRPLELAVGVLSAREDGGLHFALFRGVALLGLALLLAVFAWWCRILRIAPPATVLGLFLLGLHPIHAGVAGGIDTFAGSFIYAIAFAGAALIARGSGRLVPVATLAFATTLLASLFKEYGYGAWLIGAAAAVACHARSRAAAARQVAAALVGGVAAIALLQAVRLVLLPPEVAYVAQGLVGPRTIAFNLALYLGGTLLAGYTPGIFADRSIAAAAVAGGVAACLAALVTAALVAGWRSARRIPPAQPPHLDTTSRGDGSARAGWRRLFPLLALPGTMLPNLIVIRISEVYLSGAVTAVILLATLGLDALLKARRARAALFVLLTFTLAAMGVSQALKVRDARRCGDATLALAQAVADATDKLPPSPTTRDVVLVAFEHQISPHYSVFRLSPFFGANIPSLDHPATIPAEPPPYFGISAMHWYGRAADRRFSLLVCRGPDELRDVTLQGRAFAVVSYDPAQRRAAVITVNPTEAPGLRDPQ